MSINALDLIPRRDELTAVELVSGSQEWLDLRRGGIGASDVGAILGLFPEKWNATPLRTYRQKKGLIPDSEPSWEMECGHGMEDRIARRWAREVGAEVHTVPTLIDTAKPWRRCNIDRIAVIAGAPQIWEVKWTGEHFTEAPPYYLVQVLYQMAISGIHSGGLVCAGNHMPPYFVRVEWDSDLADSIVAAVDTFQREHIEANAEPAASSLGERKEGAFALLAGHEGAIDATPELAALVDSLRNATAAVKAAQATEEESRVALLEAMATAGATKINGAACIVARKGSIKYAEACKSLGIAPNSLEPFRGNESRYIKLLGVKED